MFNDIRDDLEDLHRRTTPVASYAAGTETTTSTLYDDLTGLGPAVVAPVGSTGICLISWSALLATDLAGTGIYMSVALSGSFTLGAADDWSLNFTPGSNNVGAAFGVTMAFGGITPGNLTITPKYRVYAGPAVGSATYRRVAGQPLGA